MVDAKLFPPDLELLEELTLTTRPFGRFNTSNDTGNEPFPERRMPLFCVWQYWPLCKGLPPLRIILFWLKQHVHSLGVEPKSKVHVSNGKPAEVVMRVINTPINVKTIKSEPTRRWIGLETIVDVILEEHEVAVLADSGSQVNTIMPEFANAQGYPVLPLEKLVNHPVDLVGIGGWHIHPFGFVIARLQVKEVAGYNEDVVFLVISDQSAFSSWVPLVLGTCMLGRIINIIKESELDQLGPAVVTERRSRRYFVRGCGWRLRRWQCGRNQCCGGVERYYACGTFSDGNSEREGEGTAYAQHTHNDHTCEIFWS